MYFSFHHNGRHSRALTQARDLILLTSRVLTILVVRIRPRPLPRPITSDPPRDGQVADSAPDILA